MNVLFKVLPSSSAQRISTSVSCGIGAAVDRQYNLSLSEVSHGFVKWDIASIDFLFSTFTIFDLGCFKVMMFARFWTLWVINHVTHFKHLFEKLHS